MSTAGVSRSRRCWKAATLGAAVLAALSAGATTKLAAADATPVARRVAVLRETFPYPGVTAVSPDVPPADAQTAAVETKGPVVELAPLTITESLEQRDLARHVDERLARDAAEKFNGMHGGLMATKAWRHAQADIGCWVEVEDRVAGAMPTRELMVNVKLLRIRW